MNGIRYPLEVRDRAVALYRSGLSAKAAAKELGLKPFTVKEWLSRAGVIRTMSEAASLAVAKGQLRGFPRQHLSWVSKKTGEVHVADSRYETARMAQLDADPSVAYWTRCSDQIEYVADSGRVRRYVPDLRVTAVDGSTWIEEVKPRFKLTDRSTQRKINAAVSFYRAREMEFRILTERDLADTLRSIVAIPAKPYDGARARELRKRRLAGETQEQSAHRKNKMAARVRRLRHVKAFAPLASGLLSFGA
jgi:hypothetical protein